MQKVVFLTKIGSICAPEGMSTAEAQEWAKDQPDSAFQWDTPKTVAVSREFIEKLDAIVSSDNERRIDKMGNIISAIFTSVWDGESSVVSAPCKVDMDTKRVFDIQMVDAPGVETLDKEYIETEDGRRFPVRQKNDAGPDDFWYD